jgi:hypothetical protein
LTADKENALTRVLMRAWFVEMAGVEPASEEKTIEITTYIVGLSSLAAPDPTDRILDQQPSFGPLSRTSPFMKKGHDRLFCLSRRFFGARQKRPLETGYLIT